ncbi:hypothetical protein CYMTET_49149 [Cymbomonas tetramitiformis]|uniref:Uncharacterized protein n=1 Tax=Cymbomonas tetramitiformis TaxID=36881 RepID=A0AAE0EU64_9CHLO|nr:hypothetical protein CYMTET_49149 [Cymbomonas tetramitiformis]
MCAARLKGKFLPYVGHAMHAIRIVFEFCARVSVFRVATGDADSEFDEFDGSVPDDSVEVSVENTVKGVTVVGVLVAGAIVVGVTVVGVLVAGARVVGVTVIGVLVSGAVVVGVTVLGCSVSRVVVAGAIVVRRHGGPVLVAGTKEWSALRWSGCLSRAQSWSASRCLVAR